MSFAELCPPQKKRTTLVGFEPMTFNCQFNNLPLNYNKPISHGKSPMTVDLFSEEMHNVLEVLPAQSKAVRPIRMSFCSMIISR